MASKPHVSLLPVFSLLLAATLWGVVWYPLRLLEQAGLSGLWTTLISYGTALAVGGLYLLRRPAPVGGEWLRLAILGLAAGWCNVSFIIAVLDGTVVRVLLLFYLSPVWAVLLGRLLLGERLNGVSLLVLALAVGGAVVMLWDPGLGWPWPRGHAEWLAISSGFAFALSNVMVRGVQTVAIPAKTTITWLGVVVVTLVWMFLADEAVMPDVTNATLFGAVLLGLFGFVAMTLAVQYGVTHMPVQRSAVILLFEVVAGAVSAQLLSEEVVVRRELIGGLFIIIAAYLAARVPGEAA